MLMGKRVANNVIAGGVKKSLSGIQITEKVNWMPSTKKLDVVDGVKVAGSRGDIVS